MIETVAGLTDLQIKLFTAIGQILVAGAVGVIAWRQWRTARNKLKADLFDRRFKLFCSIESALDTALTQGKRQAGIDDLEYLAREVKWVFGKGTEKKFRSRILGPFTSLFALNDELKDVRAQEAAAAAAGNAGRPEANLKEKILLRRMAEARKKMLKTPNELRVLFDKPMTLKH